MNRKLIIMFVSVAVIIVLGYLAWQSQKTTSTPENAIKSSEEGLSTMTESVSKGVLPSLDTNPLNGTPNTSPTSKTNPFSEIKTNPFE